MPRLPFPIHCMKISANFAMARLGIFPKMARIPTHYLPPPPAAAIEHSDSDDEYRQFPLGAARAQLHATYIIAETANGIVLVDQHAAHERLVYESLKAQRATQGIASQALLIPEIVELPPAEANRLVAHQSDLASMGLVIEEFGTGAVAIQEIPALLSRLDLPALIRDLAVEFSSGGNNSAGDAISPP